jgi:hypothetical protein
MVEHRTDSVHYYGAFFFHRRTIDRTDSIPKPAGLNLVQCCSLQLHGHKTRQKNVAANIPRFHDIGKTAQTGFQAFWLPHANKSAPACVKIR